MSEENPLDVIKDGLILLRKLVEKKIQSKENDIKRLHAKIESLPAILDIWEQEREYREERKKEIAEKVIKDLEFRKKLDKKNGK
jgi:hypothetical protein